MATDPLAITQAEPTPAPAPQPGLFDGQMPMPQATPALDNDSMIVPAEAPVPPVPEQPEETQVAGVGAILKGILSKG